MGVLWNEGERDRQNNLANGAFRVAQRTGATDAAQQILELVLKLRENADGEVAQYQLETIYGNLAGVLLSRGRLAEALDALNRQEAICVKLDYLDGLQRCHGARGVLLRDKGQLNEAYVQFKKPFGSNSAIKEAICLETGNMRNLGFCYWNWGKFARDEGDPSSAEQKLREAIGIFTKLGMARELLSVQADLHKIQSG